MPKASHRGQRAPSLDSECAPAEAGDAEEGLCVHFVVWFVVWQWFRWSWH